MKLRVMTGYFSILALYAWDSGKCYWEGVRISYPKTAVWAKFGFLRNWTNIALMEDIENAKENWLEWMLSEKVKCW